MTAAGADVGTVAKLMGRGAPGMLLNHCQHVMDKQKRSAVESLPAIAHVPDCVCPNKKALTDDSISA